jgi:phosphoribosylformylglycinamidine synthase
VAHGEGKFVAATPGALATLEAAGQVALRYSPSTAGGDRSVSGDNAYPWNPNGSQNAIAGICNPQGTVFGLMPHPEDHIRPEQGPGFQRGECGNLGLPLFQNGVRYAAGL